MNVLELFKPIKAFVFDVDGVLTDGQLLVMPNGLMARRMNIKDGYAIQLAIKKQYMVVVISGGSSPEVVRRLNLLGVQNVLMEVKNKLDILKTIVNDLGFTREQVLYMGDDMPDLACLKMVGLPCCPADAVTEIVEASKYVSALNGGYGCVRDVIEKVLKLNDDWNEHPDVISQ
jgi:3-deoxy-D-manno-octulosonate 8-phosphate phosphatase (KDO 8-P phosphatase)